MEFNGIKINDNKFNELINKTITKVLFDPDILTFLRTHKFKVDKNFITDNLPKFNEFINERDNKNKVLKGYIPHLIVNIDNDIEISYQATSELQKEQAKQNNFQLISLPENLKNANLSEFSDYDQDNERRFVLARKGAKLTKAVLHDPKKNHRGWFIYGNFGVGKTYLCGAIANELIKKYQVILLHVPSFISEMKGYIGTDKNALIKKLDYVKKIDVLMLDDIGANILKPWSRDEILGVILEYRMQHKLITFFTSNYSIEMLQEHMQNTNELENNVTTNTARIIERIRYLSDEMILQGENFRLQKND